MEGLIAVILKYKYLVIFPIATLEGPILAIILGFLVSLGSINLYLAFAIVIAGDSFGDFCCYALGRWGVRFVHRYGHKIGVTPEKFETAQKYFLTNRKKALFLSKVLHGIGFTGLIVAGSMKMQYRKFFVTCFLTTVAQYIILFTLGILFGHAYAQIGKYLDYYAAACVVVFILIIGYIIFKKKVKVKPPEALK